MVFLIFQEKADHGPFYIAAHGLSVLIIIGGILNFLGLAFSISLKILFFLGLFSTIVCIIKKIFDKKHAKKLQYKFNIKNINKFTIFDITYFIIVFVIIVYLVFNLSPSQVFNTGDDLKKYIPRTVKMLETGSIGNDIFSSNGLEVLGAQEYLHGFIHMYFPVEYMDMFDSVFCFMFSFFILFELFRKHSFTPSAYLIPLILLTMINPQKVNISSLYSGTLFIICIIYALSGEKNIVQDSNNRIKLTPMVSASLFCSSLLTLKHTYLPFIVIFTILYFFTILFVKKEFKQSAKIIFQFIVGSLLFTLPWIMVYFGYYTKGYLTTQYSSETTQRIFQVISIGNIGTALKNISSLFFNEPLQYGGTNLGYTSLALFTLIIIFYNLYHNKNTSNSSIREPALAAGISYIIYYFMLPLILPLNQAVRYPIPILCAFFPIIMGMTFSMYIKNTSKNNERLISIQQLFYPGTIALMLFLSTFIFFDIFAQRIVQIYKHKTRLCFSNQLIAQLKLDSQHILSNNLKNKLLEIQNKTRAGSRIFVWVAGPFHLDFQRNEIFIAGDLVGLMASYIHFPTHGTVQNLKEYLKEFNIDYIMWERRAPHYLFNYDALSLFSASQSRYHRAYAKTTLTLYTNLFKLIKQSKVIYDEDFTVIRL